MIFKITGVDPMGAVRMTQRSKYKDSSAKRYLNYKTYIGLMIRQQYKDKPIEGPVEAKIRFIMPISKSKQGKNLEGKPHVFKADIDNLCKGLFDSVNNLIWKDDCQIFRVSMEKVYESPGCPPGIILEVI